MNITIEDCPGSCNAPVYTVALGIYSGQWAGEKTKFSGGSKTTFTCKL